MSYRIKYRVYASSLSLGSKAFLNGQFQTQSVKFPVEHNDGLARCSASKHGTSTKSFLIFFFFRLLIQATQWWDCWLSFVDCTYISSTSIAPPSHIHSLQSERKIMPCSKRSAPSDLSDKDDAPIQAAVSVSKPAYFCGLSKNVAVCSSWTPPRTFSRRDERRQIATN